MIAAHRLAVRGVGGDEVLAGQFPLLAAAGGLAVEGEEEFFPRGEARADPARQGRLEGSDVQGTEDFTEGRLGGCLAAAEAEGKGECGPFVAAELGNGLVALGAGEHRQDGKGEDGGKGVAPAASPARVGDFGQNVEERKRGSHENGLQPRVGPSLIYALTPSWPTSTIE
jgi:hypothetical protein